MLNLDHKPIPMTKSEARKWRKMVLGFIHRDLSVARCEVAASSNDADVNRLDRVEAFAFAAICESYPGIDRRKHGNR
jgi:hypothetical protein